MVKARNDGVIFVVPPSLAGVRPFIDVATILATFLFSERWMRSFITSIESVRFCFEWEVKFKPWVISHGQIFSYWKSSFFFFWKFDNRVRILLALWWNVILHWLLFFIFSLSFSCWLFSYCQTNPFDMRAQTQNSGEESKIKVCGHCPRPTDQQWVPSFPSTGTQKKKHK